MGRIEVAKFQPLRSDLTDAGKTKNFSPEVKSSAALSSATAAAEKSGVSVDLRSALYKRLLKPESFSGDQDKSSPTSAAKSAPPLFSKGGSDSGDINFNDVDQNQIGDCYLMSSLAAVAKNDPEAIRSMIRENKDENGNVVSYTVTFHKKDTGLFGTGLFGGDYEKVEITVTPDEFYSEGAGTGDNGEVWVKVIEAAYGKFVGGKDELNGGNAREALEHITGRDAESYDSEDYSMSDLEKDITDGKNIIFDTKGDKKKVAAGGYNLIEGHSYTVEKIYTDPETGEKMVQLYNPHGHNHPKPIPESEWGKYFDDVNVN